MLRLYAITGLLLLSSITAFADDEGYVILQQNNEDMSVSSYALKDVSGITLSNGALTVVNGSKTIAQWNKGSVHKIYFSDTATGISTINTDKTSGSKAIYDISGRKIASGTSIESLPSGAYIIKSGNKVQKVIRK